MTEEYTIWLEHERNKMNTESETIKHGTDGWGLEVFSRDEEHKEGKTLVWGTYLYERTVKGKTESREVVRLLSSRAAT